MNREKLLRVRSVITREPDKFNYNSWFGGVRYASAPMPQGRYKEVYTKEALHEVKHSCGTTACVGGWAVALDCEEVLRGSTGSKARELLGLSADQGYFLLNEAPNFDIGTLEEAVNRINFLLTGEVDVDKYDRGIIYEGPPDYDYYRLSQVRDQIAKEDVAFDYGFFGDIATMKNNCGTPGCVMGWTLAMFGERAPADDLLRVWVQDEKDILGIDVPTENFLGYPWEDLPTNRDTVISYKYEGYKLGVRSQGRKVAVNRLNHVLQGLPLNTYVPIEFETEVSLTEESE